MSTLGERVGAALVQSLDYSYEKGFNDARVAIEKELSNLPVRTRQGVELIERGAALRIVHEMGDEDAKVT